MRPSYFLVCALLSPAVIGCSDSLPPAPNVIPTPPTAVHITSGVTPLLVAYRDGFDTASNPVAWTVVSPPTTMVTFMAHDMYSVAVVCAVNSTTVLTWQTFRTVGDDVTDTVKEPVVTTPCQSAGPTLRTISGTAAGTGFVHLDGDDQATTANTTFTLHAVDGTYDFVTSDTTAKKAVITRNFVVNGDNPNATAAANAGGGMALVSLTPSLTNPPPAADPKNPKKNTETVLAQVEVLTKNNSGAARVFTADFNLDTKVTNKDQTVTVFGIPDAVLTKDDTQSIKFIGTNHIADTSISTTRSVSMPFAMGDDVAKGKTSLTLPARLATAAVSPGWGVDTTNRLSVALPSLPALDDMTIETSGTPMTGTKTALYELHITAGYLNATKLARPLFDTKIMGFLSDWTIDFNKAYSRQITTEHDAFDDDGNFVDHETSASLEDVDAATMP